MVTAANENERVVIEFFAVLSTGDLTRIRALLHDEATWIPQVQNIPGAGTHRGKKGIVDEFLAPVRGMFKPGDPKTTITSIASNGSLVLLESFAKGLLADGRIYDNKYAWAVEVKDGSIFAIREYMDSLYISTLFGAG
ncbi:MAG: nuclear transport factor 2 family protein [Pseudomonadota bacterium]